MAAKAYRLQLVTTIAAIQSFGIVNLVSHKPAKAFARTTAKAEEVGFITHWQTYEISSISPESRKCSIGLEQRMNSSRQRSATTA
jgi:hypothetical protein